MVLLNNNKNSKKQQKKKTKKTANKQQQTKNRKKPALKVDMVPFPDSRVLQRLSKAHFNHRRIWEDLNNDVNDDDDLTMVIGDGSGC